MADNQGDGGAPPAPSYIGDGVYVSFDGYQIWLAANDHRNKVVALEPGVLEALIAFARDVNRYAGREYFKVGAKP